MKLLSSFANLQTITVFVLVPQNVSKDRKICTAVYNVSQLMKITFVEGRLNAFPQLLMSIVIKRTLNASHPNKITTAIQQKTAFRWNPITSVTMKTKGHRLYLMNALKVKE